MNKTKYQSQNFHFLAQNLDISAQKFEIFTAEFHFFGCRIPQGVTNTIVALLETSCAKIKHIQDYVNC